MSRKLTVLAAPIGSVGHVNATIGVAEALRDRGHRIVFVVEKPFKGRLIDYRFEEIVLEEEEDKNQKPNQKPGENLATMILESGLMTGMSPFEKMRKMLSSQTYLELVEKKKKSETQMKAVVDKYKPDVILIDDVIGSPSLIYSKIPWVLIASTNPLYMIDDERTPPGGSGLPLSSDKKEWKQFAEIVEKGMSSARKVYNDWITGLGFTPEKTARHSLIPDSPYLNIYGFPEELDYTDVRPLSDKWLRIDSFTRRGEHDFKLPESFVNRNKNDNKQKLIYLSMGSMGSIDVKLMKRLVDILSKSSHKYIVSKGLFGDKYELADNMWGQNSLPQTKVLPLVDLVITHGGNNTVTETFSFGKPMIVMPLFADQFDNAQRVEEKGFGIRLEPFNCTQNQLLESIEKLLKDSQLKDRLKRAVKRIENSQSLAKAAKIIENLVV